MHGGGEGESDGRERTGLAIAPTQLGRAFALADTGDQLDPENVEFDVVRDSVRARLFPTRNERRQVGRYLLLRPLGSGGMGMVLAAHDPELDREVAIKVVHREHTEDGSEGSARLLREARAIARLAHPNVVAVHDAGVHEGRVFLVMELVDGQTLRAWLTRPRPWTAIVETLIAAGRGLAAAHAAGIVHRDFKPANVLIGREGRPRVVDFGLARPAERPSGASASAEDDRRNMFDDPREPLLSMTVTGTIMGTPAYMAPEQFRGAVADARSDQFAFCVTLFEALYGRRPFDGESLAALGQALLWAPLRFPERAGVDAIPEAVRLVLARGLARRRDERFPELDSLLAALRAAVDGVAEESRAPRSRSPSRARRSGDASSRLQDYLDRLPRGLESYPRCEMRVALVRAALTRCPLTPADIDDAGSVELQRAHAAVSAAGASTAWVREVHARVVLAAIFDRHLSERSSAHRAAPGRDPQVAWRDLLQTSWRSALSAGFFGFVVQPPGSSRLLGSLARAWSCFHRGSTLEFPDASDGVAIIELVHPAGRVDILTWSEVHAAISASLELARARFVDLRELQGGDGHRRLELRWA